MPRSKQDNKQFVEAVKKILDFNAFWNSRADFSAQLQEFDVKRNLNNNFTDESIITILSRRKNTTNKKASAIREFLKYNGIHYNEENKEFDAPNLNTKKLKTTYDGEYQFLYDVGRKNLHTGEGFLSARIVKLENSLQRQSGIKGEFTSYSEDRTLREIASEGEVIIDTADRNSDMMLLRFIDPTRSTPPIVFMVRYSVISEIPVFFGIGLGYRFEITNSMSATRIIGLPSKFLGHANLRRISDKDIGVVTYKLLSEYLHGKNLNDTPSVLNAGPEYITESGTKSDLSMLIPALFESTKNDNAKL